MYIYDVLGGSDMLSGDVLRIALDFDEVHKNFQRSIYMFEAFNRLSNNILTEDFFYIDSISL